ncbi:hypothetical protein CWC11_04970 [Pseudoalteromonas sp. S3178]|uniref:hypothetical protein n=1 Tax=Pseudoalteromonas sp. S3178 TaxID=579532 RepID=UPI00110B8B42|nr:hypothetical protein [Pseudoalteromonas sp. S3178]TMP08122.1 hypothetical protein CWC11_04970 [Pseudoalteromonas sp. S3178]
MKCEAPPLVVFDALVNQDNTYFFKGTPFTGVAIFAESGIVVSKKQFLNGQILGDYDLPFIDIKGLELLDAAIDQEWDGNLQLIHEGKPFNGVVYETAYGWVCDVRCIIEGWELDGLSQQFHKHDCYSELIYGAGPLRYEYIWNEPSVMSYYKARFQAEDKRSLKLAFSKENRLRGIYIYKSIDDIFSLNAAVDNSPLKITSFNDIKKLSSDNVIELSLQDVTDIKFTELLPSLLEFPVNRLLVSNISRNILYELNKHAWLELEELSFHHLVNLGLDEVIAFRNDNFKNVNISYENKTY